jgi:hypothetical protein
MVLVVLAVASVTILIMGAYMAYALPQWSTWPYTPGSAYNSGGGMWMSRMLSPYVMNGGMMGGQCQYHSYWGEQQAGGQRISIQQASDILESHVARFVDGFAVHEVMEFQYNFYAIIVEKYTGIGAFELLINPYTGVVSPELGPNMMWNIKYGMHNVMMGLYAEQTADMPVTAEEAKEIALNYLRNTFEENVGVDEPIKFYGYYTLDYTVNNQVYGMLSVNGFTGQVWPHTWHGQFIQEMEVE